MSSLFRKGFALLLVWYMVIHICLAAISGTTCDPSANDAQSGASAACTAVDTNAECKTGASTCSCKSGYKEGSPDSNSCVLKSVSDTTCDPSANDAQSGASAACTAVDTNAECKTGASTCSCKSGYKEGSPDSNSCVTVLKSVSGTTCDPSANDAQSGASAACTAVDTNAECKTGASTCSCKSGYKEGSPDSNSCVLKSVAETDCDPANTDATTGGAAVCEDVDANAECPAGTKKCACKAGYKQDATKINTCVTAAESSATSAWMTTSLIGTSLLTLAHRLIY